VKLLGIFAVLAALLAGSITPASSPRSWIDDPLPGSVLPAAPVEIVAHSFDDAGVVAIVLSVDGDTVSEVVPSGAGDRFVMVRMQWDPPGPGSYLLQIQGRASDRTLGSSATAVIQIGATVEETTTTTVGKTTTTSIGTTTTTAPVSTSTTSSTVATTTTSTLPATTTMPLTTTTTTSCGIVAPVATTPVDGSAVGSTVTLGWSYGDCDPAAFTVQVSIARDFSSVESGGTVAGSARSWTATVRCGLDYFWRVRAEGVDTGPWSSTSWFTTNTRGCA